MGRESGGERCGNSSGKQGETDYSFWLAKAEALQVEER